MAVLPNSVDYTDKDFDALRARLIALVRSVFPDWSDFSVASFGNLLIEMYAFVGDVITFYLDNQARESRLGTATQRKNVIALARMLGYRLHGAQAATAEVPGVPYQVTAAPVAPAIPAGPLFAGARVDSSWEQDLLETLNLAQSGLSRDNRLQNEARRLAVSRQSEHVHAGRAQLIIDIPAPASSVQGESMLIGDRLPEVLAQYRFSRYGLSVGKTRSGLRQIVMLLE